MLIACAVCVVKRQCAKPDRCRSNVWRLPSTHRFAVDKKLMRAPRWKLAPVPAATARDQGDNSTAGSASGGSPPVTALDNLDTLHKEQNVQDEDADRAASACTTHRAHPASTGASPACAVSGGGIRAVRALASAAEAKAADNALFDSNRNLSSSSSSSSSSCSSPLGAARAARGAGGGFSLSAYGGSAGMGGGMPGGTSAHATCHDTLEKRDAALREAQRAAERGSHAHANGHAEREKVLNHIRCGGCGRAARPNVLMFDDDDWVDVQTKGYRQYAKKALAAVKEQGARFVIIEGGCGKRVPTVRQNSDKLVKLGAHLIRINLDFPGSKNASKTISLEMRVLEALEGIDMAIRRLRRLDG
eukprot:Tamp_06374.p3 GENE.Tamp_06374~~Tamp_06374.p3  ORF type:complete len:360 (+),score=72.23 Tamp_06374:1638-2717(+)